MGGRRILRGHAGSREQLVHDGAVVLLRLRPTQVVARWGAQHGRDPVHVDVHLLIDTGASTTFVQQHFVDQLGIVSSDRKEVRLADQKTVWCPIYRAAVDVPLQDADDDRNPTVATVPIRIAATPSPLVDLPHHGLLGRDFLAHFDLVYHGGTGRFELSVAGNLPLDR